MIPPSIAPETPGSERRVYGRLREALPDSWTVMHSQRFLLPGNRRPREGELDFLILNPDRGVIGLEVKGGQVGRTADGWYSVDRHGERHSIKDPGRQASGAIFAIGEYLNDARGFGRRGFRCQHGWGVVFPDTVVEGDLGPDIPRPIILDSDDLANMQSSVERIFDYRRLNGPLPESAARAFVDALHERFPPASTLAFLFRFEDEDFLRLTDEQLTLLDSLAAHKRAAIEGAAGTGKTVLAMEKARRLATTGGRVLLLCFNIPLATHLRRQAQTGGFTVETFHQTCERLAGLAGIPFRVPEDSRVQSAFYEEEAPILMLQALQQLPEERYDAIVVDEGQDFLPDWWPCLDDALKEGNDGTLYAFYDADQSIYGDYRPPDALDVIENRLVYNCRNTVRIFEYATRQAVLASAPRIRVDAPQGTAVEEVLCGNADELARRVAGTLARVIDDEGISASRVAILSTRTIRSSPFADDCRAGRFPLVSLDAEHASKDAVVFETLFRFKGLEADVVLLLVLPGGARRVEPIDVYVAATRARHLLVVFRYV